jgi:hypothetical protein
MQPISKEFETYCGDLEQIVRSTGEPLEGNCVYYHHSLIKFDKLYNKQLNLKTVAMYNNKPNTKICEIGFNAGHSALLMMLHAPHANYTFFDLGEHSYTRPCFEYVKSKAMNPDKISIHYGDSRTEIPKWIAAHSDQVGTFDIVHVDGGHIESCVVSDTAMAILLVKPGGIVIVDDTNAPQILGCYHMWERAGILERMPQHETPDDTYAHILARRTYT